MPATPKLFNKKSFEICAAIDVFWELIHDSETQDGIDNCYHTSYKKILHQLAITDVALFEFNPILCAELIEYMALTKGSILNQDIYFPQAVKQALMLKRIASFEATLAPMPQELKMVIHEYDYQTLAKAIAFVDSDSELCQPIVSVSSRATEIVKDKISYLEIENNIERKLVALKSSKHTLQALMRRTYTKAQYKQLHRADNRKGRPNITYSDAEAELIITTINMIFDNFMTIDTREKIIFICRKSSISVEVLKQFILKNYHSNLLSKQEKRVIDEIHHAVELNR
ncbi:hypothetical protein [uncultured Shewanella sp.]|uniref:hypothetical protein n=1 Tax=uncultured Shewanella sp. TaxID=173975 RepID=UPI002619D4F0|nr:hypothetical protein [uncultured Shewanella sp.]